MNLNEFAKRCHEAAISWWQDPKTGEPIERNPRELLMLAISEIAECMEGERKNLMDDKLPHRKMAEVEMADYVIRLGDYAGGMGIDDITRPAGRMRVEDNNGESLFHLCNATCEIIYVEEDDWSTGEQIGFAIACAEAYCEKHGYDLWGAVEEKMIYSASREDHKHEQRQKEGGKQF